MLRWHENLPVVGWLRLKGSAVGLSDGVSPAMVLRRQEDFGCRFETRLDFAPTSGQEEAGLTVWMNDAHHCDLAVTAGRGGRQLVLKRRVGDISVSSPAGDLPPGPIRLAVDATEKEYVFGWIGPDGVARNAGSGLARYLSTEVAGGFTGMYFGLYATGNGRACGNPADFDHAEYRTTDGA